MKMTTIFSYKDDGDEEDLTLHGDCCETCGWPEPYYGEDEDDD